MFFAQIVTKPKISPFFYKNFLGFYIIIQGIGARANFTVQNVVVLHKSAAVSECGSMIARFLTVL